MTIDNYFAYYYFMLFILLLPKFIKKTINI